MQSYQTAKNLLYFLIFAGWVFVALCVIAGVAALPETGAFIAIIGAALLSIIGFMIVGMAQMGLAQIATAENTYEMLQIIKNQNGPQSLAASGVRNGYYPAGTGAPSPRVAGEKIKIYKGYVIKKAVKGVEVEGQEFENVILAEKWINKNPKG